MFCHNCGTPQSDDAAFCAQCGARQTLDRPEPVSAQAAAAESVPTVAPSVATSPASGPPVAAGKKITEQPARKGPIWSKAALALFSLVALAWISLVSLHAYATWPRLTRLEMNGLVDFVLRALAPVVLLWLVIGYFQLGARLRRSDAFEVHAGELVQQTEEAAVLVKKLVDDAQAALQRVESQIQKLRRDEQSRMRAVQPRWELNGRIAHEKTHEINLRNAGAAATDLRVSWDKTIPMAVILSETNLVDRGGTLTIKAMFLEQRRDSFEVKLDYSDGVNQRRAARIVVVDTEVKVSQDEV